MAPPKMYILSPIVTADACSSGNGKSGPLEKEDEEISRIRVLLLKEFWFDGVVLPPKMYRLPL